jgi:hypothetical protein
MKTHAFAQTLVFWEQIVNIDKSGTKRAIVGVVSP